MAEIYYKVTDSSGNLKFLGEANSFDEYEEERDSLEIMEDPKMNMEIIPEDEYNKLASQMPDSGSMTMTDSDLSISYTSTGKHNLQKNIILSAFVETGVIPSVETLEAYYQWLIK